MEKLNEQDLNRLFQDVRSSYRILALYQKRLLDLVKYIGNQFEYEFEKGGYKFADKMGGNATHFNLDYSGWSWLILYFYSFKFKSKEIEGTRFTLRIIHQADTGFYDAGDQRLSKLDIDKFKNVENSVSRLFLILSKVDEPNPIENFSFEDFSHTTKKENFEGVVLVSHDMIEFKDQDSTNKVLHDFNQIVKSTFNIEILKTDENTIG